MYKTILELDNKVVITNCKAKTIKNKYRISIQAKDALLNYTKAIPKYLLFIYDYFLNCRPKGKRAYYKFKILYNKDINKIMIVVKDEIINYKFYSK